MSFFNRSYPMNSMQQRISESKPQVKSKLAQSILLQLKILNCYQVLASNHIYALLWNKITVHGEREMFRRHT